MKTVRAAAVLAALGLAPAFAAVEVAGVKFEDKEKLGTSELVLNGAGMRSRFMFKVYAIGMYLPEKAASAEAVLQAKGPKRLRIVTLRELTAEQFADALVEGMRKNHDEAQLDALAASIDAFRAQMLALGTAAPGAQVSIDFQPASGTQLVFQGRPAGKPIPGEAFYRALLRIWVGERPAAQDLKDALLGKPQG